MGEVTSSDGTVIAFERSGEGPPVILVGGALSDRSGAAPLAALLESQFTVVGYDRRGRGSSGDTAPYAVEREIEDLQALIAESGGSASVFGASSGAVLALEAAARGLAITRLALWEPPFIVDDSRPPLPEGYATRLTALLSADRRGDAVELFMTRAVGVPADVVAGMRNAPMWPGMEKLAHTLVYDGTVLGNRMSGEPLSAEPMASVAVPALVMDGGASPAWARHAVQAVADALPDARYRCLEGQDHAVAPEVLAPVLAEFLLD